MAKPRKPRPDINTPDIPIPGGVWVTKYALTHGIWYFKDAEICASISENMISISQQSGLNRTLLMHKPHWHTTLKDAQAHAEQMRRAEIASLKRRLNKMQALKFPVVDKSDE